MNQFSEVWHRNPKQNRIQSIWTIGTIGTIIVWYLSMIQQVRKRLQRDQIVVFQEVHRHFSRQLSSTVPRRSCYWKIASSVHSALGGTGPRPDFSSSWPNNTRLHPADLPGFGRPLLPAFPHNASELHCYEATNRHPILYARPKLDLL